MSATTTEPNYRLLYQNESDRANKLSSSLIEAYSKLDRLEAERASLLAALKEAREVIGRASLANDVWCSTHEAEAGPIDAITEKLEEGYAAIDAVIQRAEGREVEG